MAVISTGKAASTDGSFTLPHSWTMGDLQRHLGGISADRVRLYPPPGSATAVDADQSAATTPGLCELVDGVLVEKAIGTLESLVAMEVAFALRTWLEVHPLGIVLGADGLVQLGPQLVRGPSVSLIRWERFPGRKLPVDRIWAVVPDLAVEVLSPGNTQGEMERKVVDYLGAGAGLVWIVDPATRTAVVHSAGTPVYASPSDIDANGEICGGAILPGFMLELSKIFRAKGR